MISVPLSDLFGAASAVWQAPPGGGAPLTITSISTDTRELLPGSLFVGLNGARFSGADFAEAAFEAGARAVLVEAPGEDGGAATEERLRGLSLRFDSPVAITKDARAALGGMARLVRSRLAARTVAITGSCGKTSTKAILGHMLKAQGDLLGEGESAVVCSPKSFNNYVGVPRTLFLCEESTRYAVLEVGTNAPGEIEDLAAIAQPDVAMITMIGRAHLEGLGSLEGVAREKGALIGALKTPLNRSRDPLQSPLLATSCAILNADCPMTPTIQRRVPSGARLLTFGLSSSAEVRATDVAATSRGMEFQLTIQGRCEGRPVVVPLLGDHAVANVLAALAAVLAVEGDLEAAIDAIAGLEPEPHRLQPTRAGGVLVIDDAYNANPESMAAAIRTLVQIKSGQAADPKAAAPQRILVAGAMGEMGEGCEALHAESGEVAGRSGIDRLFLAGDAADALQAFRRGALSGGMDPSRIHMGGSLDDTVSALCATLSPGDICLVKASRAARLERVVDALVTYFAEAPQELPAFERPSSARPGAHA